MLIPGQIGGAQRSVGELSAHSFTQGPEYTRTARPKSRKRGSANRKEGFLEARPSRPPAVITWLSRGDCPRKGEQSWGNHKPGFLLGLALETEVAPRNSREGRQHFVGVIKETKLGQPLIGCFRETS